MQYTYVSSATGPMGATLKKSPSRPLHGQRAQATYQELRALIVRGVLKPGERLREARLARQCGVSRTPIREALDRLKSEGFVVAVVPGLRTELAVAPLTLAAMQELWTLMGVLEGAAMLALEDMGRDRRRQLAAAMAEVNDCLAAETDQTQRNVDRIAALMSEFHQIFMDACAGPHLSAVYARLRPHVQRYEWAYGSSAGANYLISIREHRDIIDALGDGDAERARQLLERHWQSASRRTSALLQQRRAES